jgi:hypothetical protein
VTDDVVAQPPGAVTVTLYVPEVVTSRTAAVAPVDQL